MGSQSVTNFSDVRMKRIRSLVKDYTADSPRTAAQVREIGAAAVSLGSSAPGLTSGKKPQSGTGGAVPAMRPANEFLQALSSPSVTNALHLITTFANELKRAKNLDRVYDKYDVKPDLQTPFTKISGVLTQMYSDDLSSSQADTDSAFAGGNAITKTIIDLASDAYPNTAAAALDRDKFANVFKADREKIVTAFMQNVVASLIDKVLDATRGSMSTTQIAAIKRKVREDFVPEFIERLKKGE